MRQDVPPEALCPWKIHVRELTVAMAKTWNKRGKSVESLWLWKLRGCCPAVGR
jgi:hypothetical protein